jgi:hypothetical protein
MKSRASAIQLPLLGGLALAVLVTTFSGAAAGKSAMKKMGKYTADLMPVIQTEIDAALRAALPGQTK